MLVPKIAILDDDKWWILAGERFFRHDFDVADVGESLDFDKKYFLLQISRGGFFYHAVLSIGKIHQW